MEDDGVRVILADGIQLKQWLKRCWDFLQNYAKPQPGENSIKLDCLLEWPLIPTTCGKLVTIEDAKCILDMTAQGKKESAQQQKVRKFVTELECPVLDKRITFREKLFTNTRKVSAVTDSFVAHPYNAEDVLVVLCRMLRSEELHISKVYEKDIRDFLQFVQDEYERSSDLEKYREMVKDLPFHKALDGKFVSLLGHYSTYVLVPPGVSTLQLSKLQNQADCLFLNSDGLSNLTKLYTDLGVRGGQNVTHFYVDYVFKHFKIFTRESQIKHLEYIKENIFPQFPQGESLDKRIFLKCMKETPCIPDENGRLHFASDLFYQGNGVFIVMFADDLEKFPPPPFNETSWLQLLRQIGLQVEVTPKLFLQFCRTVADNGKRSSSNRQSHIQSKELVKCLFSKKALQKGRFLSEISQIKFITSAKVEDELALIHEQYQCPQNHYPPFIAFRDAVPWGDRYKSWTTVAILPDWAQPNDISTFDNLGIAYSGPKYVKVLNHLKKIANPSCLDSVDGELLQEITKSIYKFLSSATQCRCCNPDEECSEVCVDIGNRLRDSSCIFLQEDKTFVKAEQLVFKMSESCSLKPFLYVVPTGFGELQHFLKRLGATTCPTPLQIANVLRSIRELIGDGTLSHDQDKKARFAMRLIFHLLEKGKNFNGIEDLYLPSESQQLFKSSKMICEISPRYTDIKNSFQFFILLRFEACGLKKPADFYINALPKHLTPTKFDNLVEERVAPESKRSICSEARGGALCEFQEQFQNLIRSDEFQEGLKRLLVHHRQNPKEFEQRIKKLQTDVEIKCAGFECIKVRVTFCDANDVFTNLEESCYAVQEKGKWSLYMQHELIDDRGLTFTATCVNKILGDCIQEEKGLIAMLHCSLPSEISNALNKLSITYSTCKSADDFLESDDEMFLGSESDDGHGSKSHEGVKDGRRGTGRGKKRGTKSHGGYSIGPNSRGGSGGGRNGNSR